MSQVQTPVDPRYLTFGAWADAMRVQNRNLPRGEMPWVAWGQQAQQFEPDWPDPRRFADWRAYAAACMGVV